MDFALSEEQTAIFDMARDFGASHIAPFAREWEAAGEIPKSLWPQLAELGFGGLYVREESPPGWMPLWCLKRSLWPARRWPPFYQSTICARQ